MTTVLVTGALGGSGRWIVDRLATDGYDVACVVQAALAADVEGHEPILAAAAENYVGRPTVELVEDWFGEVPDDCDLDGEESAMSTARAGEVLDWEPEYTWREAENEQVGAPDVCVL